MNHTFDDTVVLPALKTQLSLNMGLDFAEQPLKKDVLFEAPEIDLGVYDRFIVCFSGGKDSIACILRLLDMGVDKSKIELWHHRIDDPAEQSFMDWSFMESYVEKFAEAFDIPLYFSWLDGGFKGEMLKKDSYSRAHKVETPEGLLTLERNHNLSKPGTREKFPQQSASLATRWCSSALKIDVSRRALTNQARFNGETICFITGERREESPGRSKYNQFERHPCDARVGKKQRRVDWWKAVLHFNEAQVWDLMKKHNVTPPVPYRLFWSRSSCMTCIYNSPRIWATIKHFFNKRAADIAQYENQFNCTISRKMINVMDISNGIEPFEITDTEALEQASKTEYFLPIFSQDWSIPPGAFGSEGCGSV